MENYEKERLEMDELKLKLSTKFMRGIIAKLVSKTLLKKFGYEIDIQINEIEVTTHDGKIYLHVNVDAETSNEEFKRIIKSSGLDEEV